MKIDSIKTVCVVGCGLMGRQIALNTAIHGYNTCITDIQESVVDAIHPWAEQYLQGRMDKGKITAEQARGALKKLHAVHNLAEAAKDAQLVIEAIVEDKDKKNAFFAQLDAVASKNAIFATNSSFMGSSLFKASVSNPCRIANLHYFNPALVMKLTEVIQGDHTSDETVELLMDFSRATGKRPIHVRKEVEGFVVSRILRAIKDEAFWLVENGVCSPEDVDAGTELGLNHPMGPFRLNDLTGIDLTYHANERRLKETGVTPPGYAIIKGMYEKNELGRKTGKGFYAYEK